MQIGNGLRWLVLLLASSPVALAAQPAESCLPGTMSQFLLEIDDKLPPSTARGNDFLLAYGWMKAAQVCIDFEPFPQSSPEEVQFFESRVSNTVDVLEDAIRTGSQARLIIGQSMIVGDATGIDTNLYVFPKTIPGNNSPANNGPSGNLSQGPIVVPLGGAVMADSTPSQPLPSPDGAGYRMLSMDEWRFIQARLTRMGHDTGGADGIVGPNTYAAIERYQRANGLAMTGLLSSEQLDSLLR